MEYYLCLDFLYLFLHYIHMSITFPKRLFISLHFEKKRIEIDQGRAELQFVKCCIGVKIKSCRNSISMKLNSIDSIELKKGVKCDVMLDQC